MRKEGKYLLGTISEISNELYNPKEKEFKDRFTDCDFAIVSPYSFNLDEDNIKFISDNSTGWYGIKKLDTGFDNAQDCVDLFADYYGGGCGTYRLIVDYDYDYSVAKEIEEMIVEVLSFFEGTFKNSDIIVCELR